MSATPSNPWAHWDLPSLLIALDLPKSWSSVPSMMTSVLFLVLQDHGWDGSLDFFCPEDPAVAATIDQHTCLTWKGESLDAFGADNAAFAASQGIDPATPFRRAHPFEVPGQWGKFLPGVRDRINSRIQAVLLSGPMPVSGELAARPRQRL